MKYLAYEVIEALNNQISTIDDGDLKMFAKIEVYSCKSTNTERKLKHLIDKKYEDEFIDIQITSPTSPFGPLSMKTSKKTLFYLVSTLNCVYPDYDFRLNIHNKRLQTRFVS